MTLMMFVASCHRLSANVRGSVGLPTPGTQVIVVDPDTHSPLPDGQQGLVLAAGPGVMAGGYLGDQQATHKAFVDGWFDTGEGGHQLLLCTQTDYCVVDDCCYCRGIGGLLVLVRCTTGHVFGHTRLSLPVGICS